MPTVKNKIIEKIIFAKKSHVKNMNKLLGGVCVASLLFISFLTGEFDFSLLATMSIISMILVGVFYASFKEHEFGIKNEKVLPQELGAFLPKSFKNKGLSSEDIIDLETIKKESVLSEVEYEFLEREVSIDGINNKYDYIIFMLKLFKSESLKELAEKNKSDPAKVIDKMIKKIDKKHEHTIV